MLFSTIESNRSVLVKQRIFISSVQKEFAVERRALRDFLGGDALLRRCFDVFLFEDLPASDRRPGDAYIDEVEKSGIYVGLFGKEYGAAAPGGKSPTEREFDCATEAGKTRFVFIKDAAEKERDPRMAALIKRAGDQLIRRRFQNTPDLFASLYASLVDNLECTGHLRTLPFDAAVCRNATVNDISKEKMASFLEKAQEGRGYPLSPKTPVRKALVHLNLLDRDQPNHAAILLFGAQPQRFLISSEIKCMHFHGEKVQKPIPSYQIYKGTVFELVDQAMDFVMSKIDRGVGTRAFGPTAPVTYELPRDAVAEAIVNAVAHRDYASNASVQVMLFSNRLEIWNPGHLPPPLTPESLCRPHASIPRNPLIADPLFLSRYIEKAGTGILDMIDMCKQAKLHAPQFRQDGGQFIQTLWRPKMRSKTPKISHDTAQVSTTSALNRVQIEKADKSLLNFVLNHVATAFPNATAQVTAQVIAQVILFCREPRSAREIMAHLHLHHWKTFQVNYLEHFIKDEMLKRTIPDKPTSRLQKYRLTEKGRTLIEHHAMIHKE
jgi:ATP-dependent DNA helicase RecG